MAPLTHPLAVSVHKKVFPAVGMRGEIVVLKDIAFKVERGSFVVITGPSGGGKSTLLNIIAGLDKDYEGSIEFGDSGQRLAYVFQSPRLLPWRTVYENIALALPDGDPRIANIPELIERVGLKEAASAYPEMISLGMQRRAALARAFVLEPEYPADGRAVRVARRSHGAGPARVARRAVVASADDGDFRDARPRRGGHAGHPHLAPVGRLCEYL